MPSIQQPRFALVFLALVWAALCLVRLTGPFDLMDKDRDQEKPAAYVLDAVRNGEWLVQRSAFGEPMSKPPLYTWLAVAGVWAHDGELSRWALALPSALAVLGVTLLVYGVGRRFFGAPVGFWAALFYLGSNTSYRQLALFRTDPLFVLTVFGALVLAYLAWRRRSARAWLGFWLLAALATLTKGPLGPLLAAGGFLSRVWERFSARPGGPPPGPPRRMWPVHVAGLLLFLALTLGWFGAAVWQGGQPVVDHMLGRELVGHAVGGGFEPLSVFKPFLYMLTRYLPWSLLGYYGLYRIVRHPAPDTETRAFERFIAAYFLVGLVVFSLATHKRMDLYYPLLPVVALCAGREAVRLWGALRAPGAWRLAAALSVVALALFAITEHSVRAQKPDNVSARAVRAMALAIRNELGAEFPLTHVYAPYAVQYWLNTMRVAPPLDRAEPLMQRFVDAEGAFHLVVDTRSAVRVQGMLDALNAEPLYTVARAEGDTVFGVHVLSNRAALAYAPRMQAYVHGFYLRLRDVRAERLDPHALHFTASGPAPQVFLENWSDAGRAVTVHIDAQATPLQLAPGAAAAAPHASGDTP